MKRETLQKFIIPVLFIFLWSMISWLELISPRYTPSPIQVVGGWWEWIFGSATDSDVWYSGTWLLHLLDSLYRVLIGFIIAAVAGVVLGVMIGWFRLVSNLFDPFIQLLRPIPVTAWLPFSIVFFGIQDTSAIFLIAFGTFFPIVVNSTAGAQHVPKVLIRAALMLGTKQSQLLRRVVFPSALPSIFTGLRLGIGLAWVLVIVAEMLAVDAGLGRALWTAYEFIRMDLIVAAMVSIGIMGFLSDRIIVFIRDRALRWAEGI
ncbi:MAG: ABC transporter permease [Nitrospinota bacterium]|jgi:NitT/TauT family transport system permease protein|nr:ABC transporter permease [Nitrospinota bacterium]MDP7386637.1 ABC transporter permease [Nitrospinota bacterium]